MLKKYKFILAIPIKLIFFGLDLIIPKKRDLITLATKSGKAFSANLDILNKKLNEKNFETLVIAKNGITQIYSLKVLWKILRSKYVYLTHGPGDIQYALYSPRKTVIYIGHGTPVKTFIFTYKAMLLRDRFNHIIENWNYKYIIASSDKEAENLAMCFNKKKKDILITGTPRNELLVSTRGKNQNSSIRILYAPTYRSGKNIDLFPFKDFNLKELDRGLGEIRVKLEIKIHMNQPEQLYDYKECENIVFITSDKDIHYELMNYSLLITDYSSLYVDFLLLNKPIIFLDYDLEDFSTNRGFLYDFRKVTPGRRALTQKEFLTAIVAKDLTADYETVRDQFHLYKDNFCDRIIEKVHL